MSNLSEPMACFDETHFEAEKMMMSVRKLTRSLESSARCVVNAGEAATKEAKRLLREAREERARAQKMREKAEAQMVAAQQERERAQRVVDEQLRQVSNAFTMERLQEEDAETATTSPVDVAVAKRLIQYEDGRIHIAITGCMGSGKTSLCNALLGGRNEGVDASTVEGIETCYSDARASGPFKCYVAPGTSDFNCRDWQYFNDHHLYLFDRIIVLFNNSFTMTDIAVLVQARSNNIPTYIVCSKADHYITTVMNKAEEEDAEHRNELYQAARRHFLEETRRNVQEKLEEAKLPYQRVYIVSSNMILGTVLNKNPEGMIDEADLLNDLRDQTCSVR